jgi:hypothetical protein
MDLDEEFSPYTCGSPSLGLDPAFAVNWVYWVCQWRRICAGNCEMSSPVGYVSRSRRGYLRLWHIPSLARVHTASTRQKSGISASAGGTRISGSITI